MKFGYDSLAGFYPKQLSQHNLNFKNILMYTRNVELGTGTLHKCVFIILTIGINYICKSKSCFFKIQNKIKNCFIPILKIII